MAFVDVVFHVACFPYSTIQMMLQ